MAIRARKGSFPRSMPQMEVVDGAYVISEKTWEDLNTELQFQKAIPHPPEETPVAKRPVPSGRPMNGIQFLMDATRVNHMRSPPKDALEEANSWRGLIHLVTASRKVDSRVQLSLPTFHPLDVQWKEKVSKRKQADVAMMQERKERQLQLISSQQTEKSWHDKATEDWESTQIDSRLETIRDQYNMKGLERKIKKTEEDEERGCKNRNEIETAFEAAHALTAQQRREKLAKKRQMLRERELAVDKLFSETAKLREKWQSEKSELGMQGAISIDLSCVNPRTGQVAH